MKDLTVIIPNFNKGKYIERCLLSVINQSDPPSEIIVVDDFSTDNSREIIAEMAKRYTLISPVFLDANGGVSNARNIGIKSCTTMYLTFMDSDDYYYNKDKLRNEMERLLDLEKKGLKGLAYSTTVIVNETGDVINCRQNKHIRKHEFIVGDRALRKLISLSKQRRIPRDYCIRKATILEAGGYSYPKNFYEDLDLLMRIARCGTFFQPTYEEGTAYRQVSNGLSNQTSDLHSVEMDSICKNYLMDLNGFDSIYAKTVGNIVKIEKNCIKMVRNLLKRKT